MSASLHLERTLRRAVDPEIGLIKYLVELELAPDEPRLHILVSDVQDPMAIPPRATMGNAERTSIQGTGAGFDRQSALWATVGESLERYAVYVYDSDDIVHASHASLKEHAVDPRTLILFSEEQYADPDFRFQRPSVYETIGWVKGWELRTHRQTLVPASVVFLGYQGRPHEYIDAGYSTGTAAGADVRHATRSGLLEVIERDGFMCHWLLKHSPAQIPLDEAKAKARPQLRALLEHPNVSKYILDISTELGIPCVLVLLKSHNSPGVAIGAACRLDPVEAMEKATIEAFHTLNWTRDMVRSRVRPPMRDEIREFQQHVQFYLAPENFRHLAFLLNGPCNSDLLDRKVPQGDVLDNIIARLHEHALDAVGVDITPADVESLGLRIVRTIVPGLHPIYCGTGNAHLDRRRLDRFAAWAGLSVDTPLNTDPHPFP